MENVIFYTFSTIPQVLAGAIALIGVFALYKIQELKTSLYGISENFNAVLIQFSGNEINEFRRNQRSRDYDKLQDSMHIVYEFISRLNDQMAKNQIPYLLDFELSYTGNYAKIKKIKSSTIKATIYTAIIILCSIIVLPFTHNIVAMENIEAFFFLAFLLVGFNLWFLVRIIYTSL